MPAALTTLRRTSYDPNEIVSLPAFPVDNEILHTTRKVFWEVEYCVRRNELRGKCLGDISIASALDSLYRLGTSLTTNVWLIVAGSFSNSSAIKLYLCYGFKFAGMYRSALMMTLNSLDQSKVTKAHCIMQRQVDSFFILPGLKRSRQRPPTESAESEDMTEDLNQSQVILNYLYSLFRPFIFINYKIF
jgi:hypothetical protein